MQDDQPFLIVNAPTGPIKRREGITATDKLIDFAMGCYLVDDFISPGDQSKPLSERLAYFGGLNERVGTSFQVIMHRERFKEFGFSSRLAMAGGEYARMFEGDYKLLGLPLKETLIAPDKRCSGCGQEPVKMAEGVWLECTCGIVDTTAGR